MRQLGQLEAAVMARLWSSAAPMSVLLAAVLGGLTMAVPGLPF